MKMSPGNTYFMSSCGKMYLVSEGSAGTIYTVSPKATPSVGRSSRELIRIE